MTFSSKLMLLYNFSTNCVIKNVLVETLFPGNVLWHAGSGFNKGTGYYHKEQQIELLNSQTQTLISQTMQKKGKKGIDVSAF